MFDFLPHELEDRFDLLSGPQPAGRGFLELSRVAGRTEVTRSLRGKPAAVPDAAAGHRVRLGVCRHVWRRIAGGRRNRRASADRTECPRRHRHPGLDQGLSVSRPGSQPADAHGERGGRRAVGACADPLTCFAQARYEQSQSVRLYGSGSLVLVDWLTSGRRARGESWALSRYYSRLRIYHDDELVLADALLLDPADGRLDSPFRLGRFHCLAMMVLIGGQLAAAVADLSGRVAAKPVQGRSPLVDVASPLQLARVPRHDLAGHW